MLAAGDLNCRVTIKAPPTGQDSIGQPSGAWTTVASVWAGIAYQTGLETIRAGEVASVGRASILIAWRDDVTAAMRVHHGSTVYEIKSVQPDMARRDRVYLVCEVVNAGA